MTYDNTRYDQQGHGVELTCDRSANSARALDGYTPDVRPDTSWPGLDGSGKIQVEPGEVKRVAEWLHRQAGSAESLPKWLSSETQVTFGPSSWHEANNLKAASQLVSEAVATYLGQVAANMTAAAGTLTSVHDTYTGTEQANTDTVQHTNANLGDDGGGPVVM